MIVNIYAFYDSKTGELSNPFFTVNDEVVKRDLTNLVNDVSRKEPFILYPEDFSVYKVGEFDSSAVRSGKAEFKFNCLEFRKKVGDK